MLAAYVLGDRARREGDARSGGRRGGAGGRAGGQSWCVGPLYRGGPSAVCASYAHDDSDDHMLGYQNDHDTDIR